MKWLSLMLGLGAALLLAGLVWAQLGAGEPGADAQASPALGMAQLADYRCRRGETRQVLLRGVEDGFSVAGAELAGLHPRLAGLDLEVYPTQVGYDSVALDARLTDSFDIPSNIASGLLLVRLRPNGDNANDALWVGDLSTLTKGTPAASRRLFAHSIAGLPDAGKWNRQGELLWVELSEVAFSTGGSLLEFIQSGSETRSVVVSIADDTAVDFMAVAYCLRPPGDAGVTLAYQRLAEVPAQELAGFECRDAGAGGSSCDPIVGDRSCRRELPLLCFRDLQAPAPTGFRGVAADMMTRRWSGGEVAATAPVRGDRFATITEADRYCAARFGQDWRVAEWHLGGSGWGFSASSGGRRFSGRYWIDIRGAPYGTCWRRDHDD